MHIGVGRKYTYEVYWTNAGTGEIRSVEIYKVEGEELYHSSEGDWWTHLPTEKEAKATGYWRGPYPVTHL